MSATETAATQLDSRGELKHVRLTNIVLNDKAIAIRGVKMESEKFKDLVASIRLRGVMTPISLRMLRDPKTGEPTGMYGMVGGLHRYTACSVLKMDTIPALIREVSKDDLIDEQLTENVHRIAMRPAEEANAIFQSIASHPERSMDEVAQRLGKSRGWLDQRLSITKLPTVNPDDIDETTGEPKQPLYGIDVQALVNLPDKDPNQISPANAYLLSKLIFDPPVPEELWKLAVQKAQTYTTQEYTAWSQIQVNQVKQARKTGKKVVDQNVRVPLLRSKAEITTHLDRIKLKVAQMEAKGEKPTEYTKAVIDTLQFVLQIDDKTWAHRQSQEAAKDAAREAAKQERLAGKFAESLSLGGIEVDQETAAKAKAEAFDIEKLKVKKEELQPESAEEVLAGATDDE